MPVLIKLMLEEPLIKMQTQATSAALNFVNGLLKSDEDEEEEETAIDPQAPHSKPLLQALVLLLQKGIQQNYEPLQTEVLQLLSSVAQVILENFTQYYNDFMPMMQEILQKVGMTTMPEKQLRAKAIDTIGSMIISVTDSEEKDHFKASVMTIADYLAKLIQSGLGDDDPQDTSAKDTLTQCAGFLGAEFA